MTKLKIIIPTIVLFAAPWMHKIIYMNIMSANIGISSEGAHTFAILGATLAGFITFMMVCGP